MKLSDRLFEEGVFAQGIAFPTVARDKARVRTIVTATHTRDELQFALDVFARRSAGNSSITLALSQHREAGTSARRDSRTSSTPTRRT